MKSISFLILLVVFVISSVDAQADNAGLRTLHCVKDFQKSGWTTDHYVPNKSQVNLHLSKADQQFKASRGLLAGGLASAFIGSGAVLTGTLGSNQSKALPPYSTPLIITGAALNIVVMPVCFVLRDVMIKKATRHVKAALALNP